MDALRQLILTELKKKNLSYRAAADRAEGLVSYGHLNAIVKGRHPGEIHPP